MTARRSVLLAGLFAALLRPAAFAQTPSGQRPALMLSGVYRLGIPLQAYWLSEKYDGLRGFWDGQRLLTRGGQVVQAPSWFTAGWPTAPMDGELWVGRGQFEQALSTVRQQTPDDTAWRSIRFMVFDLPGHGGPFSERIAAYQHVVQQLAQPWVQAVEQEKVHSHADLMARLDRMVLDGGEGLMLHRDDALYRALRSDDLLKVKTHEDAEARVVGQVPGQGKYVGLMGALLVQTADGRQFRLGTGFTDAQRQNSPAVGAWVTYRFRGLHASGLPRFASFLRVRTDMNSASADTAVATQPAEQTLTKPEAATPPEATFVAASGVGVALVF
ncbi:MAG: DNA ligase [Hydrogenophaga sp.]|uniref:DNA ligase n=1 Tax=Hydrogenophaga sp. TaxID=1904254 RepID=UPI00276019FF|nr:DNA ligase [Hydrogenophaga sp.]MDP2419397.1 DNA ligase [Hydrogenophaga sp.]MDZ4188748.1 DNA ligase [Hydrogenophaga sp.]